jgi:phenylalanyl-tRNA synthetase beta chain
MLMLRIPFIGEDPSAKTGYYIEEIHEPTFFDGRAAAVFLRQGDKTVRIGEFGVMHPTCLNNFELKCVALFHDRFLDDVDVSADLTSRYPTSALEINLEILL